MVSAQRQLPSAVPSPPALYPKPRRLSPQCVGRFGDRRPARRLLCWMLLVVDDVVVRWWRDERVLDHGDCDAGIRGESRQRTPCLACCRCRPHLRRYLAADAIGYVTRLGVETSRLLAIAECAGGWAVPFQAEVAIGCTMVSLVSVSIVPQAMEEQSKLAERILDHVADAARERSFAGTMPLPRCLATLPRRCSAR